MGSDGLICLWRSCEHSALDAIDADMLRQPTQGKLVGVLSCDDSRLATMRLPPPEGFVLPPIPRLHEHKMIPLSCIFLKMWAALMLESQQPGAGTRWIRTHSPILAAQSRKKCAYW